ncbi:hypothetical protein COLO4_37392 [Corchorus olitorius]|uniref:Uncharacterized protein n=1 Tax=Corchorus olitorius TaxID=93759 RepID=A0A1R3G263_9ROSI|nr:hypothetical protein COLO4_37392 [Corchorus olitorius]
MGSFKAPGVDEKPTFFFKKYWHIVGEDTTKVKNLENGYRQLPF